MKAFEYEIVTPERLIKFDKPPDFRGKPRVMSPPPSNAGRPFRVGTEPPARASSHVLASSFAAGRIESFHPATGSGPPAPLAA
ncbi:hypothetical protein [Burkholderia contaminans]|uniref:hypothetical protein n=1 Tax=Burkholderia contaminans TaxID=488447 RepID=UPI003D664913